MADRASRRLRGGSSSAVVRVDEAGEGAGGTMEEGEAAAVAPSSMLAVPRHRFSNILVQDTAHHRFRNSNILVLDTARHRNINILRLVLDTARHRNSTELVCPVGFRHRFRNSNILVLDTVIHRRMELVCPLGFRHRYRKSNTLV